MREALGEGGGGGQEDRKGGEGKSREKNREAGEDGKGGTWSKLPTHGNCTITYIFTMFNPLYL